MKLQNLKELLEKRGEKTNLSSATGISTGNISDWFNPKKKAFPSAEALCKVADYFECSIDYLLGRTPIKEVNLSSNICTYLLPVYDQDVAAGSGQLGFEQNPKMKEFQFDDPVKNISYGVHIKGHSMETDNEKSIPNGSTIFVTVKFDYNELVGEAVVANIKGSLVCKEYQIADDGHLWLKSRNDKCKEEDRHIYNPDGVKIIGKVVKVVK